MFYNIFDLFFDKYEFVNKIYKHHLWAIDFFVNPPKKGRLRFREGFFPEKLHRNQKKTKTRHTMVPTLRFFSIHLAIFVRGKTRVKFRFYSLRHTNHQRNTSNMNVIGKFFGYGALCAFMILSACNKPGGEKRGPSASSRIYPVQEVKTGSATLESVYPVTLKGEDDAEIKPRVNGYIDKVYVNEGEKVKKGQRLFSINAPSSEQDFAAAEAALSSAEAQLNTAKIDVERIRGLAEKDIVSKVQLQNYENAHKTAEANKQKAQAVLKAARAEVGWTMVPSPIDGVVGSIPYRTGNMVSSATTLTTISNTKTVFAYFSINEKTLSDLLGGTEGNTQEEKIKNIPPVSLVLPNGSTYTEKGIISTISGVINTVTGSVNLRAEFPNAQGVLRSGASGNISIPKTIRNVVVIPQKATFSQQDKIIVYKVEKTKSGDRDSTYQAIITVQPLPDGQHYAVTGGLKDGDRIVTDGVATLRNGSIIQTN